MSIARHHHFLPQCYLKGFTIDGAKKSKLVAVDLKEGREFATNPRNVGGARDFNRVEVQGLKPDAIEGALSRFETGLSQAMDRLENTHAFSGTELDYVLNLIALLHVRTLHGRTITDDFQRNVAHQILQHSLATRQRWDNIVRSMKEDGKEPLDGSSYLEMKQFFQSGEYELLPSRERSIELEFDAVREVLRYLKERTWTLLEATVNSGPFITSDRPVALTGIDAKSELPFRPGVGLADTELFFPISKNLALLGVFDGVNRVIAANSTIAAMCNTKTIMNSIRYIYSPHKEFKFMDTSDESIKSGSQVLEFFGSHG